MKCKDGFSGCKKKNVTWSTRKELDWLLDLALVDLEAERQVAEALSKPGPGRCVRAPRSSLFRNFTGETRQQTDDSHYKHSTMAAGEGRGESIHTRYFATDYTDIFCVIGGWISSRTSVNSPFSRCRWSDAKLAA